MTERNKHHTFKADVIPCQETSDPAVLSKTPLVSAEMITYNHELYIAQAIEGVLMQKTDFPIELIIGEDCSTDRTHEIVLEYQKKHPDIIRVVTSEHNVGMIKNSLRTNKACRGKYIAFCESDDYWIDPYKLQKQVDFLEANADYGMVHTDCDELYQSSGKMIKNRNKKLKKNYGNCINPFWGILTGDYSIFTCTVMVRKSLVMKSIATDIFNNPDNLQGDLPMWLEIANKFKLQYISDSTAVYRKNLNSASNPASKLAQIAFQESSKRIRMEFAQKYGIPDYIMRHVSEMNYSLLLTKAFYTQNYELAKESYSYLKEYNRLDYILKYYAAKSKFIRPFIFAIRNIRKKYIEINLKIQRKNI